MIKSLAARTALWITGLCAALLVAEACIRLTFPDAKTIIPPSTALASIPDLLRHYELAPHVCVTTLRVLIAFGIAACCGVTVGVLLASSKIFNFLAMPVVDLLRPLPSVAVIPLVILFFGYTPRTMIVAATFGTTWPIALAAYQALVRQDQAFLLSIRQLRLSWLSRLWLLELPAAFPRMVSGLQIGASVAVILIITGEIFITGRGGVGSLMTDLANVGNYSGTYGCVVVLAFLGLGINQLLSLGCSAIPWNRNQYEVMRD